MYSKAKGKGHEVRALSLDPPTQDGTQTSRKQEFRRKNNTLEGHGLQRRLSQMSISWMLLVIVGHMEQSCTFFLWLEQFRLDFILVPLSRNPIREIAVESLN